MKKKVYLVRSQVVNFHLLGLFSHGSLMVNYGLDNEDIREDDDEHRQDVVKYKYCDAIGASAEVTCQVVK